MTFQGDPYRTLGIGPGASLNEIKSAYRRLVKQYHPDAAGERALPRFLAIQASYERLVDGEGRLRPAGSAPGRGAPRASSDPWRADPTRARASRDAWRARRSTGSKPAGGSTGTAGAGTAGSGSTAGSGGFGWARPGAGARGAGGGAASNGDAAGKRRDGFHRERHVRRGPRKATPGSTTYDEAADLPLDREWDGGAWYGPSSGTYWTINPREYADPRKHGPEYLARARRAMRMERGEALVDDAAATDDATSPLRGPSGSGIPDSSPAAEPQGGATPRWRWSGDGATTTDGGAEWGTRSWRYDDPAPGAEPGEHGRPGTRAEGSSRTRPSDADDADAPPADLESIARRFAPRSLLALALRSNRRWRVLLALVAWPPIGYAIGALLAEVAGCGSTVACSGAVSGLSLAAQPIVVAALFLVPPAAAAGAFAALAAFAVAVPSAAVLALVGWSGPRAVGSALDAVVVLVYAVALVVGGRSVWRAQDGQGAAMPRS